MLNDGKDCLRICETCPWLKKNQGKKHPANWYTKSNLKRLWTGIRTGNAPGMICHSTDPGNGEYGGKGNVNPGHEQECAGAITLVIMNMNALSDNQPQPIQPPLTESAVAHWLNRVIFAGVPGNLPVPEIEDRRGEVGVPWGKQ